VNAHAAYARKTGIGHNRETGKLGKKQFNPKTYVGNAGDPVKESRKRESTRVRTNPSGTAQRPWGQVEDFQKESEEKIVVVGKTPT